MNNEERRDVDVLFVGSLDVAVQRERLAWVARLSRLAGRRRVCICSKVYGEEYRKLLGRARIVFNRSIRGECNRRTFEAAAAGALLFQEAGNREVPAYFRDRQECVYYTADNLEGLLDYYLEHEDERQAVAEAGRARVRECGFGRLWGEALGVIERECFGKSQISKNKNQTSSKSQISKDKTQTNSKCQIPMSEVLDDLLGRTWEALSSTGGGDPGLVAELADALVAHPRAGWLHHALGLAVLQAEAGLGTPTAALVERAAGHFQRAWGCDPDDLVARLNHVEALVMIGSNQAAIEQARAVLKELDASSAPHSTLNAPHFPFLFDTFRVEWERAAWVNAGDIAAEAGAKRDPGGADGGDGVLL